MSTGIAVEKTEQGKPQLGAQMPDSSYYMGVSPDVGEDFCIFIEGTKEHSIALQSSPEDANLYLNEFRENKKTFHGHKLSEFQSESEVIKSYKENKADGGLRRLTSNELQQVEKVFRTNESLREKAMYVFGGNHWLHSCPVDSDSNGVAHCLYDLNAKSQLIVDPSLMLGRSDPKPKVG